MIDDEDFEVSAMGVEIAEIELGLEDLSEEKLGFLGLKVKTGRRECEKEEDEEEEREN